MESGLGDLFLKLGSGLDDFFPKSGLADFFFISGLEDFLTSGLGDFLGDSGLLCLPLAPSGLGALALPTGLAGLSDGGVGDRTRLGLGFFGSGSGTLTSLDGLSEPRDSFLLGASLGSASFLPGSGLDDFDLGCFTAGLLLLEWERDFFLLPFGLLDFE